MLIPVYMVSRDGRKEGALRPTSADIYFSLVCPIVIANTDCCVQIGFLVFIYIFAFTHSSAVLKR